MGSIVAPTNGLEPEEQSCSSAQLNDTTPEPEFLTSAHYKEWVRNLKRSVGSWMACILFVVKLSFSVGEACFMMFTLFSGIVPDLYHSLISIGLYIFTWVICVGVSEINKYKTMRQETPSFQRRYTCKDIMKLFMVFKPCRYCKAFNDVRIGKLRVIQEESSGSIDNIRITENGLKALVDINKKDLEDQRINLYECAIQSIPMALLQCYFLLYKIFSLFTFQDWARLGLIIFALVNVAMAACSFETVCYEYQTSMHFHGFYKSRGDHPMRVYHQKMICCTLLFFCHRTIADMLLFCNFPTADMLLFFCHRTIADMLLFCDFTTADTLLFLCHLATAVSRVYATVFFMAARWFLGLGYLFILFCVNLGLLYLFPQLLLDHYYCNAPFGVHNVVSYYADRWINLFCNVGTRYNKFSNRPLTFGSFRVRVPIQLIQIIHFLVPVGFTVLLRHLIGTNRVELASRSWMTSLRDKDYGSIGKLRMFQEMSTGSIDNKRITGLDLGDIFSQEHVVWLLFGIQLVLSVLYGMIDLWRREVDETVQPDLDLEDPYFNEVYPILTAYRFWDPLFRKALIPDQISTKIKNVRLLMALTVFKDDQFYKVVNVFYVFPRCSLSDEFLQQQIAKYTSNCTDSDEELDTRAKQYKEREHHFRSEFDEIHSLIDQQNGQQKADDIKLFVMFISTFDRKMYGLTSYRVERVRHYF